MCAPLFCNVFYLNYALKLKKEYKEVKHIRDLSGFGWDDAKKVVTATPEVWEALLAVCFLSYFFHIL